MKSRSLIAVACSDIHLSHNPPIVRSAEPDWYKAMGRQLQELKSIARTKPIIIAGDLFDKWNSPPELINFALQHLPDNIYAIPGQHDLPNHNYEDLPRSAYWTLVKAKKIVHLPRNSASKGKIVFPGIHLHGFPFDFDLEPLNKLYTEDYKINIAVIHQYVYSRWNRHNPAKVRDENFMASSILKQLDGFNLVVSGDNHSGFSLKRNKKQALLNCGTFFRRTTLERDYQPKVALIYSDGSYEWQALDCTQDKFLEKAEVEELIDKELQNMDVEVEVFTKPLSEMRNYSIDFAEIVANRLKSNPVRRSIARLIFESLEER